jgi:predicted dehydrogenase
MSLKLGIIGLSDGNGHPYSWSAIFNGYDPEAMELCDFPVIPRYLEQQVWPDSCIKGAEVTAVWSQSEELSRKVAKAARIKETVFAPEEMIGKVDGILLARDDAENHLKFAEPFLKAGLPVYIDKPIALSLSALNKLYELEQYPGQIFTCSALRYSNELMLSESDREALGQIQQIVAFTPKSWDKYAAHIIEPVLNMLPEGDSPVHFVNTSSLRNSEREISGTLLVRWNSGIQTSFFATGDGMTSLSIRVIGTKGFKNLNFSDSFSAFKAALEAFVGGIRQREVASPRAFNSQVVQLLERGRE